MAIKRLDPSARFRLISNADDAVDKLDVDASTARYSAYLEAFDHSKLQFVEGQVPSIFTVRAPTNMELAALNSKFLVFDPIKKSGGYTNQMQMFMEMFDLCVLTIQDGDAGPSSAIKSNELPYQVAADIGSQIMVIGTLGKNLKKD